MKLSYLVGNALDPIDNGPTILVHCCNNLIPGVMGGGIALGIRQKWPIVYDEYRVWSLNEGSIIGSTWESGSYRLGEIQLVQVEHHLKVCNLLGQQDVGDFHGMPAVRYQSIEEGLWRLRDWMESNKNKYYKNIVSPRMGAGLAGGDWQLIEGAITRVFDKTKFNWTVYDLPQIKEKL
jgi:O-acetyl-ADP-ribose deacetylase (regulator of RNase III)